jgi:protein BCP1
VVKSSEEDDPFAVMTAFNTSRGAASSSAWLSQLRDYLGPRCPDKETRAKLDKVERWGEGY